jgi:hypothetical protein
MRHKVDEKMIQQQPQPRHLIKIKMEQKMVSPKATFSRQHMHAKEAAPKKP